MSSANENGGYYIGRYEARTTDARRNLSQALTPITEKPNDYVYRWVTQLQAAELSRNMYSSNYFESDLMNSYAWDTATLFLQSFYSFTSKNLAWKMIAYSRDVPVGTLRTVRGARARNVRENGIIFP